MSDVSTENGAPAVKTAARKEYLLKAPLTQGKDTLPAGNKALLTDRQAEALKKAGVV